MTANRDRNAVGSSISKSLFVLTLGAWGLMAQLPPDIQADRYALQAESAIEEQDYAKARVALEKILELQAEHGLQLPTEFYFHYADVLQQSGEPEGALEYLQMYLEQVGRQGDNYTASLRLMNRLEPEVAELRRSERQRAMWALIEREARAERERRAAAERQRGASKLHDEMEFVRIPAGTFQMGSIGRSADSDEAPLMQVRISRAFEISKYEVTQSEWSAVMGLNPSTAVCERCPVTDVSWNDIQGFIRILNQAAGKDGPYRLPSEAEWEYASRAGEMGERYSSDIGVIAWYSDNSGGRVHQVGGKQPNAFGLHDMLGNVWELVEDRYAPFSGGQVTDPRGPRVGSNRVLRGGGWYSDANSCRSANRTGIAPGDRDDDIGFRLARTVE